MTDTTKPVELLNCQCGGTPEIERVGLSEVYGYADQTTIRCPACGINLTRRDDQNPKGGYALSGTGREKAIAAWNTRPATTLDAANAEIERLTKERDEARAGNHAYNEHEPTWLELCYVWQARAEKAEAESAALVAAAYEAAAKWHDKRVEEMKAQIAENDEYVRREGIGHSAANDYCRDSISNSQVAARFIRALTRADATAALEAYGAAKVREGREAGMKEAAKVEAFMPGSGKMKPMMKPWQDAILAAIKEKQP